MQVLVVGVALLTASLSLGSPVTVTVSSVTRPSETEREGTTPPSVRSTLPEGDSNENEVRPGPRVSTTTTTTTTNKPATITPSTTRVRIPVINLFPGSFPSLFGSDEEESDGFGDGMFFNFNPFNGFSMQSAFRRMETMMRQAEERMRQVFQSSINVTRQYPDNYDNSTSEIIEVDGHKYKLQKTVTKKGDNDSAVFVSFTSLTPVDRRKRETLTMDNFAEELHRLKREAEEDNE